MERIEVTSRFEEALKETTREWKPFRRQEEYLRIPQSVFEAGYGGAAGGGKSDVLVLMPLIYGFYNHPLYKGITFRRTFPELEAEVIQRSQLWYPSTGAVYNESKHFWQFPSGAREIFAHLQREKDARKYDTGEYNTAKFDEATSFTEFQYLYFALSRVRSKTADLPAFVRWASNPGNVGHIFFRKRFVDPYPPGGKLIRDKKTGLLRTFIQSLPTDNPHLQKNSPNYISQLMALPEAERKAKLLGDWYVYSGMAFPEWRIEPLLVRNLDGSLNVAASEPANACHVIPSFPIPVHWPRVAGIDWGWHPGCTWIGWFAIAPGDKVYLYREYTRFKTDVKIWANDFANISEDESIEAIKLCHSASQHHGEDHTILTQFEDALRDTKLKNVPVSLGKKDRLGSKMLVHEYLRWEPIKRLRPDAGQFNPELASQLLRKYGEKKYREYLSYFSAPINLEPNLPKLQVFDDSHIEHVPIIVNEKSGQEEYAPHVKDTIPACITNGAIQEGESRKGHPEDVREFTGDDPYDGLRIGLECVKVYLDEVEHKQKEIDDLDKIVKELVASGDQTSYHRKMEHHESTHKAPAPIRRTRFWRGR